MQKTSIDPKKPSSVGTRVDDLFSEHRRNLYKSTDRMLAILIAAEWVVGAAVAAIRISPLAWIDKESQTHLPLWAALILGALIGTLPITLALTRTGETYTRYVIAAGQMLMGVLLTHLIGGRIETYFYIFGSLAFLSFYQDWKVLISATLVVVAGYVLGEIFFPQSIFGILTMENSQWLECAGWVIFIDIFLVISCLRGESGMQDFAEKTVALETSERNLAHDIGEERYRELFENANDLIFTHDLNGNFTFVNKACEKITGYLREETVRMNVNQLIAPNHTEYAHQMTTTMVQNRLPISYEMEMVNKNGTNIWLEVRTRLIFENDKPVGVQGIARDITERRRAEENLYESEARYRQLFEKNPNPIWIFDEKTLRFLAVNEQATHLYGYSFDEFQKITIEQIRPPEDLAILRKNLARVDAGVEKYDLVRHKKKDGTIIEIEGAVQPINFAGRRARLVMINDITERRRAEEILRESEERFRLLIEGVRDYAILMLDQEGHIVSWNKSAERIKGYHADEIIGQHISRFYTSEDIQNGKPELELRVAEAEGKYEEEGWRVRKDGSLYWANVLITAIWDEAGNLRGFSKITRDITERKRIEEEILESRDAALESVRLKSEFLANMSHEIRTPMNGVIGMIGMLLDTDLTEEQREFAETVHSSADSLLTIINDILDFSKIEAGKLHFEKLDFDLRYVVESTVELLAERAAAKRIELASLVASNVPTLVSGDAGRLRQVLLNLANNAVKFTDHGEVTLCVTKENETGTHVTVRFAVSDTGIGISKDDQRKLFQPFVQADGSTTRKYGGTGLGLTISKQIVEMMGGEIGIESEPGQGSTFSFVARMEKQSAGSAESKPASRVDLHELRILIVDDNATNRRIFVHQTASWGMIPHEAESAQAALESLRAAARIGEPFDVALLDLMMPETDGLELARIIKADAELSAVRLILMPSYGRRGDAQLAQEIGISAYLTKPVRQSQLFDSLATVMAEHEIALPFESPPNKLVTQHSLAENKLAAGARILIVEDNEVNQKVAVRLVAKLGCRADIAGNGIEALEALVEKSYDIVLMDCQMPQMDGYEATAAIRRREGASEHTIIIAMTANVMQGDHEKCLTAGMDDYIGKPIRFDEFRRTLKRWIKFRAAEEIAEEIIKANEESVDVSILCSLRELQEEGEPDLVAELIELYSHDTQKRLAGMRTALENKDAQVLRNIAHSLKGSSGNLGIRRMAAICLELERGLEKYDWSEIGKGIFDLESEFARVRELLERAAQMAVNR